MVTASSEATTTINAIPNERYMNPVRIILRTIFPNELIKLQIIEDVPKDIGVGTYTEYVGIQIKRTSLDMLATL